MSMTTQECIAMVEKQIEFALLGFVNEIENCTDDLKESDSLAQSYDTVCQIRAAVDAMEDMFEQLADAKAEMCVLEGLES